ncbi:interferon-inducible double-stranded RNA-dependent kinase activator A [Brachionus plicatilis]|uniref:Interferon-inducible double-stranded RNA-dependent kinase activator A n=1 Tax=Brachionus plicatilis TaxID=10195 RepID=A0A3M7RTJ2_BRAPC|nr:interferon-inducible double-stranded RNA-dependent kinase activator A [Brachionus plicatilis]
MNQNFVSQNNQTPLGILNNLCSVSKVPMPTFEFEQIQNKDNDLYFTCKCYINEQFQSVAKGKKKKTAKHLAALRILRMLKENSSNSELAAKLDFIMKNMEIFAEDQISSFDETNNSISNNSSIINENDLENSENVQIDSFKFEAIKNYLAKCTNPIGEIKMIADKYSMKQPVFIIEDLSENSNKFSCVAKFGEFSESAIGRTKKLAKRYASIKLLFKIKTSGMLDHCPSKTKSCHKIEINQKFYDQLKFSEKKAISIIKSKNLKTQQFSSRILLEQLAREENFEYQINEIVSNIEDLKACLIYVNASPQLVFGGHGKTQDDAIKNAIFFLLIHLKDICSKDAPKSEIF